MIKVQSNNNKLFMFIMSNFLFFFLVIILINKINLTPEKLLFKYYFLLFLV